MMKEISWEENKQIAYDILAYFADFCESHGLRYFLAYGTLLGAVRHGGFIPWDDDIDVWMPRKDYDQFLTYKDELGGLYELNTIEVNPYCWLPFGKLSRKDTVIFPASFPNKYVRRLSIDIFPLDVFPSFGDEATACAEYARFWEEETQIVRRYHHFINTSPIKRLVKLALYKAACLRYGDITPRIKAWAHMLASPSTDTLYLANVHEPYLYKAEWFHKSVKLKFESGQFEAPSDYDSVLRQAYGDYMTPPPLNKQKPPHFCKFYYVDS